MKITVLCTSKNSIYKTLGLDCYDIKRNARSYTGNTPIIAHPPCRGYSTFLRHRAKPAPGEKDLALYCAERIILHGGILEHPAHSEFIKLFRFDQRFKITEIQQNWFGYPTAKRTWLLTPGYYKIPNPPFRLLAHEPPTIKIENMSHNQRSETTLLFAQYLIQTIKLNHLEA